MAISLSFLAYKEASQHKMRDSWFLYFQNPENESLDFIIENFSEKDDFSWSLVVDGEKTRQENVQVLKNSPKSVIIEKLPKGKDFAIEVSHGKEERKIYKIFK